MRRLLIYTLLTLWCLGAMAMETRIIGTVFSASTTEPLPNVSVYFKGTQVGTTTDGQGLFYLHVDLQRKAQLTVSCIGYKTQRLTVEPGQDAGLTVILEERREQIEEVVILPGANPALPLMDSVRAHRRRNQGLTKSRTNGEFERKYYLSESTGKTLKRKLWKSLKSGMIQQEDSTWILPLPDELYTSLAVPIPEHLDFYEPTIPFGGLSLLSPTAASAQAYYRFFLVDSLESPKRYIVDFKPKNSFDPLFTGSLTIDSASYALTDVQAAIPREANINYLTALQYSNGYNLGATGYRPAEERMSAVMDLAVKADSSHIFPSLLARQRWRGTTDLWTDGTTDNSSLPYSVNPTIRESVIPSIPDTVPQPPLIQVLSWLAWIYHTGYAKTGTAVDIGKLIEVLQYNRYELLHLGLPFRTNEKLFKHVSLEGYVGYGIRDHGVKYKTQAQVILPTQRRNILGVSWWDHYAYSDVSAFDELLSENNWGYGNMPFTTYVLSDVWYKSKGYGEKKNTAVRKREFKLWAENDWCDSDGGRPAVETNLSVQLGRMGYGDAAMYHYYDMPSFRYNSVSGTVRLSWQEKTVDLYLTRKHLYSKYPTLFLGAEMGSYTLDGEDHYRMYGQLNLLVRQNVPLGMGGTLTYSLGAGLVLGTVPYPLLAIMDGNQSYSYAPTRFTLMNNAQFMTDKYVFLHADWNGQGILFNRIPGVRYLRLRELVEFKVAYGGLSDGNRALLNTIHPCVGQPSALSPQASTLTVPYVEAGVGIGNILRIGDVYSIWRLTPVGDGVTPRWAIRFRLNLGL